MGGKQNLRRHAGLSAEFGEGGTEALGKGFGKQRMLRPTFSEVDAKAAGFGLDSAAVEAHAGAGVLRRHADDRCLLNAIGTHLADYVGNVGTPVSHADVDPDGLAGIFKFRFDKASLFESDLGERAAANERVAVLDLFDYVLRQRSAADHVAQIFGNLLDGLRRSVGKQQNGLFSHLLTPDGTREPCGQLPERFQRA